MTVKKHTELKNTLIKASHKSNVCSISTAITPQKSQLSFKSKFRAKSTSLNSSLHSSNISGPIQFMYEDHSELRHSESKNVQHPDEKQEYRNYACQNYDCCLNIVAALDWDGFSCEGCNGEVNQTLLWRAQGECSKDNSLKVICELPDLRHLKIESKEDNECSPQGLILVVNNTAKKP